jgi:hypothetical protein
MNVLHNRDRCRERKDCRRRAAVARTIAPGVSNYDETKILFTSQYGTDILFLRRGFVASAWGRRSASVF